MGLKQGPTLLLATSSLGTCCPFAKTKIQKGTRGLGFRVLGLGVKLSA